MCNMYVCEWGGISEVMWERMWDGKSVECPLIISPSTLYTHGYLGVPC